MKFTAIIAAALALRVQDNYFPLHSGNKELLCKWEGGACVSANAGASAAQTAVCSARTTGSFEGDAAKERACGYSESYNGAMK